MSTIVYDLRKLNSTRVGKNRSTTTNNKPKLSERNFTSKKTIIQAKNTQTFIVD